MSTNNLNNSDDANKPSGSKNSVPGTSSSTLVGTFALPVVPGPPYPPGQTWRQYPELVQFVEKKWEEELTILAPSLKMEKVVDRYQLWFIVSEWKKFVIKSMEGKVFDGAEFTFHVISFWKENQGCRSVGRRLALIKLFQASQVLGGPWLEKDMIVQYFVRPDRIIHRFADMKKRGVEEKVCKEFFDWLCEEDAQNQ